MFWLVVLAFVLLFVLVILFAPTIENLVLFQCSPITNTCELQSFDTFVQLKCGARLYQLRYTGPALAPGTTAPKILLLHGNAGCAQLLIPVIRRFTDTFDVYALEFRGFGVLYHHERPSIEGISTDVREALEYTTWHTAVGYSLGGVLLAHALGDPCVPLPTRRVLLINTMFSICSLASHYVSSCVVRLMLTAPWSAECFLQRLIRLGREKQFDLIPELHVVHALNDEIIPVAQAYAYKDCYPLTQLLILPCGGHIDSIFQPQPANAWQSLLLTP